MKFHPSTSAIFLLLPSILNGCAATIPALKTTEIDGRRVEFALSKHQSAPIVFENGLGATLEWWREVYPAISTDTTAMVYNRAGYGNSEAVDTQRDGRHIVQELRGLLAGQGLSPPYVLVGHSLGGLYMQWYARYHPDEVAALILVDSTHPEQLKGRGAVDNWPFWVRLVFDLMMSTTAERELAGLEPTGEEMLAAPPYSGGPVIVLSAAQPLADTSELALDANQKRKDIARLHPGAMQRWIDSGHGIPLEKPEAIISAIREVLSILAQNSGEPAREPPAEVRKP